RRGPRTSPRRHVLELPAGGERAVPDQILAPLPLTVELEQALPQDHAVGDGAERIPAGERASAHEPQQRQRSRAARPPGELRCGPGLPVSTFTCVSRRNILRRRSRGSNALYVCSSVAKPFQGEGVN